MENSNIKADYVYYCDAEIESDDINNISQMSDHVKKYNFAALEIGGYGVTEITLI